MNYKSYENLIVSYAVGKLDSWSYGKFYNELWSIMFPEEKYDFLENLNEYGWFNEEAEIKWKMMIEARQQLPKINWTERL